MKRPKWSARLLYIAVALALVIGLTPMAVFAGYASIVIDGDAYAKEMHNITFTAYTNPTADPVTWNMPADFVLTGGGSPNPTITGYFVAGSAGLHTVSAVGTWGSLTQTASFEILIGEGLIPQHEYNIAGSEATFCVPDQYEGRTVNWRYEPSPYLGDSWSIVPGTGQPTSQGQYYDHTREGAMDYCATVHGRWYGELAIYVDIYNEAGTAIETTLMGIKKWGKIYDTWLHWKDKDGRHYTPGSTEIVWNENLKKWVGSAYLCDFVIGWFITDGGLESHVLADGAIVQWWVMDARAPVYDLPSDKPAEQLVPLVNAMQAAYPSRHVGFGTTDVKHTSTSTDGGEVCLELVSDGQEAVKIVVVAKYPDQGAHTQWPVFPQILSWNFWSQQVEKVPQVAWAGEKVVLEKQFGTTYAGFDVVFNLEYPSVGTLLDIERPSPSQRSGAQQVWTKIGSDGVARAIIESESPGEAHIKCSLYSDDNLLINQHGFVVYYLGLEEVVLGNVVGERCHETGLFVPENPWDADLDELTDTLNVGGDTLLRARVKGWFLPDEKSTLPRTNRPALPDPDNPMFNIAPAGRYVLPDDWPYLAGGNNWQDMRPHWDIMTQPNDNVMALDPLGPYHWWDLTRDYPYLDLEGDLVAEADVIGPYSGLDTYMPEVYYKTLDRDSTEPEVIPVVRGVDEETGRKTIVPNAKLNWWDCPMPPAKIGFVIEAGPGYFKAADKGDIYYVWLDRLAPHGELDTIAYTNPFYEMMIPASPFIPPFINNGGYDWDSFGFEVGSYGPYPFWEFINTRPGRTHSDPQHPTWVWVYSDNHGEAMVWLNGDWNLDLSRWITAGAYDVPTGYEVGETTVSAVADYPYLRPPFFVWSNEVEKTWTWGVDIRGNDPSTYPYPPGWTEPDTRMMIQIGTFIDPDAGDCTIPSRSNLKMAFVWVTDRSGRPAVGTKVDWTLSSSHDSVKIATTTGAASVCLPNLMLENGYLSGTSGSTLDTQRTIGVSYTRLPTAAELYLWEKNFPGVPCNHAVAAIAIRHDDMAAVGAVEATLNLREGEILRHWNFDFNYADPNNPHKIQYLRGDANNDGVVNAGDITMLKRIIFGMETRYHKFWMADVNGDGKVDAGDITALKSLIFAQGG